ncbi:catechol 2,3-dioxygenase-like lactoylglutathione lyase family enzyme [Nocardioides cavernae]|uniref:Catechol 2,3-dioxygenase-like lactoylglutathione lyase family enzyme n=1 Tax=Nocardioides cavernae TaxID=1921566 RepID=A0A7Y9H2L7_9ACTN|nr:VOC family protein [Nocardioides cavernae]NYE36705.1 catechol 2,3-dioxygenase-like lactoylglutathione lyase family enzyme [Nocardioides cavernae]
MTSRLLALTVLAADPAGADRFWRALLGPDPAPFDLVFVPSEEPVRLPAQIHLHLSSNGATQAETVARALALGARRLDVGQLPDEDHVVLADPEGNAFCVIPEGNRWLAGTPFLGELACDGTREVGVFWSEALGRPLVHDEDGETAIRLDDGPIIAWGGPPLDERRGRNRMHVMLAADDLETEVARLAGLGATIVARTAREVEMADPDGNEFRVRG